MNLKKIFFYSNLAAIAISLQGCATRQEMSLAHEVTVPRQYRAGGFSKEHPAGMEGDSTVERYVNAYERGWSFGVQQYARDIGFDDSTLVSGSGWAEEVAGFSAGYADARERMILLIESFGREKVAAYLQQFQWAEADPPASPPNR